MKTLRPILLVEDTLHDVELTLVALKQNHIANEVIVTRHGGEALDFLYRRGAYVDHPPGEPVVVFLDVKMPKVDGLEVLRQMKGDDKLKMIPVVMLTSSREEADLVRSDRSGANALVVKPVGFDQFTDAIRQLGMFWAILNEPPPQS